MDGQSSAKNLAKILNLTEQRIWQLAKAGIIPTPELGKYQLVPAIQAYVKYLQERTQGRRVENEGVHIHRERLVAAQAAKTELELDERRGALLPAVAVLNAWEQLVAAFRARLLSFPSRLAPRLVTMHESRKVQNALTAAVREALQELSQFHLAGVATEHHTQGRASSKAPAGGNGKSVGGQKPEAQPGGQRRARTVPVH